MQILPNPEQGKPLAIALLALVLVVVYMVGFHWFVVRHFEMGREIDRLEQQIARFKASVAQRPQLEAQIDQLQRHRLGSALFLNEVDFSPATATLIRTLRELVNSHADDTEFCSVTNTQPQREREPGRFEQVTVGVRMQCPLPDLVRVLYELENAVPLIFVDNLRITQRALRSQRGRRGQTYGQLEVQFDMYGYLPEGVGDA